MLIPHGKLLHCLKLLQSNSPFGEQQAQSVVFPDGDHDNHWPVVLKWLKALPECDKAEKICTGLVCEAQQFGVHLSELVWWDILPQTRHLFGDLHSADGVRIRVLFIWKKPPDKDREAAHAFPGSASWGSDHTAPGGWRFEIEGETYDHTMAAFSAMLDRGLPSLPNREPSLTRISSFPQPIISTEGLLATN